MTTGDPLMDKYLTGFALGLFFGINMGWQFTVARFHDKYNR